MTNPVSDMLLGPQEMSAELNTWSTFRPRSHSDSAEHNCTLALLDLLVLDQSSRLTRDMNM